ncbi:MAG TPA: amino acid permease [Gemmatimonadaceae bacterium]|nr:amino acid permease [Gemmatimonadaceae bacterium]
MSIFRRKSLAQLQAEGEGQVLRRALGALDLTALGIGSLIGTGIFVLTGMVASLHTGPSLVVSMVLAAVCCGFAGLCYAELASMIPVAGSAYTYAYATLGEIVAWIIGWDLMLEYALSASTVAVGWSGYFVSLFDALGLRLPRALTAAPGAPVTMGGGTFDHGVFNLPAALIVLAVTLLLVKGIRESARANAVLVLIKAMVLVVFVVAGASYVKAENLHPFLPANTGTFGAYGLSGVLRGTGIIFFAFIGFDAVSTAAQETKRPQRDLTIGMLASLAICTVLYIAVGLVLVGVVHYSKLNVPAPLAVAIDATGLTWLSPLIKISALFGMFSTMLVQLLGQTRIFYSMSRDGFLPKVFSEVHPRYRTPHVSTLLTGGVTALLAGLTPIDVLGQLVAMGTLLAFVLVCIGIIALRRTDPDAPRPFRVPLMPWVPIAGALSCLGAMLVLPRETWIRLVVWLVIGFVVYFGYSRRRMAQMA